MGSRAPVVWLVAAFSALFVGGACAEESGKAAPGPSEWAAVDFAPPQLPDVITDFSEKLPSERVYAVKEVEGDLAPPDLPPVVLDGSSFRDAATVLASRLAKGPALTNPRLTRKDRESIVAFYAKQANKMVWLDNGSWTTAAKGVVAALERAGEEGLDPSDYRIPDINVLPKDGREEALADADDPSVSYGRELCTRRARRAHRPEQARQIRDAEPRSAAACRGPRRVDGGGRRGCGARRLQSASCRATWRSKQARRGARLPSHSAASEGPGRQALKVGMRDPRVPLIRAASASARPTRRDRLRRARRLRGLGFPEARTACLQRHPDRADDSGSSGRSARPDLEGDLVANMERWRWLPPDLGARHIIVNMPEFRLRLVDRGGQFTQTPVIAGKSETPTPIFSDAMETVIVNPSWFVPPSILREEFLPALAQDPLYAARRGFGSSRGATDLDPQPPGERNALGHIKFMFPNQHAVYLHDTPQRNLFTAERRAFSHGCVRLDQPFRFAEIILNRESDEGWSEQKLRSMIGRGERTIKLKKVIPIHITYFTTFVDESGRLISRDDIYGYNRRVRAALGYSG